MKNLKSILTIVLFSLFILVFSLITICSPRKEFSESERRNLAAFPNASYDTLMSGKFMTDFETATLDQFPGRDFFLSVRAYTMKSVFQQLDNNGIYVKDGYIGKLEYPVNEKNLSYNFAVMNRVYEDYLKESDCNIYLSVIPDKNLYLAGDSLFPTVDYDAYIANVVNKLPYAKYIDITDKLTKENFYLTDQHWRQETILPVADAVLAGMGRENGFTYKENTLGADFFGTYAAQSSLNVKPEKIVYLTNDVLDQANVYSLATGVETPAKIYDMKRGESYDAYEMFLQGPQPLLVIENEAADTDAELVIFRDSFGSSFSPLLASAYKKVTIVDLRYMRVNMLADFVDFENQDVLFMYSTLILNNTISNDTSIKAE